MYGYRRLPRRSGTVRFLPWRKRNSASARGRRVPRRALRFRRRSTETPINASGSLQDMPRAEIVAVHAQRDDGRQRVNVMRESEAAGPSARKAARRNRSSRAARWPAGARRRAWRGRVRRDGSSGSRDRGTPAGRSSWAGNSSAPRLRATAQSERGERIGAGRAAEAEVDAAGMQRLEHAKRFGHGQRRVIGQHDAAGADADTRRDVGHVADHDFRHGAGDQRRVVMLGEPVARVAELVGKPREIERVAQCVALVEPEAPAKDRAPTSDTSSPRPSVPFRGRTITACARRRLWHIGEAQTKAARIRS